MNEIMMGAFNDELEKIAVSPDWIARTIGHASRFSTSTGAGALGKRQEAIRMLRKRGGFAEAAADDAAEATKAQMDRISELITDRARKKVTGKEPMKRVPVNGVLPPKRFKPLPPVASLGNPGSLKKVMKHADDLDTLQHLRRNVLDRSTARHAFDGPNKL
ncbi:MAG: hypothetical protein CL902_01005 [Dehalococcoidia bacterium]|nr:hypothetical protein [Dehalococcoidia bacterium]